MLNKSDSEFSKELSNVKKQLKDKSKVSVTTTLFSKKKNYTKKSNSENVIKMAEEIEKIEIQTTVRLDKIFGQ